MGGQLLAGFGLGWVGWNDDDDDDDDGVVPNSLVYPGNRRTKAKVAERFQVFLSVCALSVLYGKRAGICPNLEHGM